MKTLPNIATISTNSLGNSLFECITFDRRASKEPMATRDTPVLVQAGVVCLCLRGSGTFLLNDKEYCIGQGDMMTIMPNTIISAVSSSDDFLGYIVAANVKFMTSINMSELVKCFVYISRNPVLHISDEQMNILIDEAELLRSRGGDAEAPFQKEIGKHLLMVLCYEIYSLYKHYVDDMPDEVMANGRQSVICREFLQLVDEYAASHRDMSFYADKLCITPKYLSVVVKKVSGHSPVEIIDRTVMLYARTLLTNSDMTVQQIAAELNFPNPSFFGQYFKRHEGITPKRFRNKKHRD